MRTSHAIARLLLPLCVATLVAVAWLSLPPEEVYACSVTGDATISKPENTSTSTELDTYGLTASCGAGSDAYALEGTDSGDFNLSSIGKLTFKSVPDYESPADDGENNVYNITVKITREGTSRTKAVTVTVTNVNEKPTIDKTTTAYNFAENTDVDETAVATIDGTEPDSGDTMTWTLSGNDAEDFEIESDSDGDGKLSFKASPNYEDPKGSPPDPMAPGAMPDNTYEVRVNVRDSKDDDGTENTTEVDDFIDLVITVTNANDAPTFSSETATRDVDENTASNTNIGAAFTATDEDGDSLTYGMEASGDHSHFTFDATTRRIKTSSALDHETKDSYTVTITVRDNKDAEGEADTTVDDTIVVTIAVIDVNEAPTITAGSNAFSRDENTADTVILQTYQASDEDMPMQSLTWSIEGTDSGNFRINPTNGRLRFAQNFSPSYESPGDNNTDNKYNLTLKVTDNGSPAMNATLAVTVTVDDVNEAPSITTTDTTKNVAENTTAVLTFAATDVDNNMETNDSANSLSWSVESSADGGKFSIDSNGASSFSTAPDYEMPDDVGDTAGNNTYVATVKVTDNGIHGERGASNHLSDTHAITVTVTNMNEAPTITTTDTSHADPSKMEIEYDDDSPDLSVATYGADDPDNQTGNTLTWVLEGDDAADFSISGSGALTFVNPPNFEMPADDDSGNDYSITVKVRDNGIPEDRTEATWLEATQAVTVTVTDVNERPDIAEVAGDALSYAEVDFYFDGTPSAVHDFNATDYDGDDVTWSLSGGDDAGDFSIGAMSGILTFNQDPSLMVGPLPSWENAQDADTDNDYSVTVRATDDDATDQKFTDYAVTITVTDEEELGRIAVSHTRAGVAIEDLTDLQVDDVLEFTLSDPDTIPTPLTDAAIDWVIERRNEGETDDDWVTLDGQDVTSLIKEYTVDEDDTGKELIARVTYTDRRGSGKEADSMNTNAASDEREVAPPRFRSGDLQTITEGAAGRDTAETATLTDDAMKSLAGITATDRDAEVPVWGIQDGKDADLFEIIPSDEPTTFTYSVIEYPGYTARLRSIEALDYETVASSDPDCPAKSLCLTLTLSDGRELSSGRAIYDDAIDDTYDVTVEVTNVDEPGEITLSPDEVPEPGVTITATHTDPDGSISGRSWQWQRSEDPEAETPVWTNISGANSATYTPDATADVVSGGDNDGQGYYLRATVSYTDGEGGSKSAMADAGQVGTANTRSEFPSGETGQRSVPENTGAGASIGDPVAATDAENNSLTYTLSGADAEPFTIVSSTGQLRVKEPLDFESGTTSYTFNIEVSDRRDAAGRSSDHIDDTQLVVVTVENVDEEGEVTTSSDTNSIQATVPIITELSDPDGSLSGITWQWARSANRSTWEDIATGATYTPTEADDQGNYLRATATYTDGEGSGKTAEIVTARVAAPPPTNAAPVFPDAEDGQREIAENTTGTPAIGAPVQATDFNNDSLTYSLTGSDSGLFAIDATGQLSLQLPQDTTLDYERKRAYSFTVRVSDGKNDAGDDDDPANLRVDDSITVTVSLIDVNEPPAITGQNEPEFRENGTSAAATYSARDPEGDSVTWTVSDTDNFVITDRGQLYFNEPPSFEDGDTYRLIVTATDDDETLPLSSSLNVTVTVTDVEEQGAVTLQPTKGWVTDAVDDDPETMDVDESLPALATRFTATLEDGDDIEGAIAWQWARTASEDITDATSDGYTATADDVGRYLRVTATYDDSFDDSDSQGDPVPESVTAILRAPIRDTSPGVNAQPRFTVPTAEELPDAHFDTRTITSGTVSGRNVGSRVSARDADGDILTYTLRGRDADKFQLDPATGQIRTREALDHLEQDTYTLSVSVHDGFDVYYQPSASIDDTISIIVTVLQPPPPRRTVRRSTTVDAPPNRPAEFADGETTNRSVLESAEVGSNVGRPVSASDPDGDALTYTLGGDDADSFDIGAMTGQLRTKAALDAETQASYSVTVSVTDNKNAGGGQLPEIDDTITVNITVTTVALSDLAAKYDADEDGLIARDEAIVAVEDYFNGDLTRDEALEVIALYFESPATVTELLGANG